MTLKPRDIIRENIECRCTERIGLCFDRERRNDFAGTGMQHGFQPQVWVEGEEEYYTDIWGNVWCRKVGLSLGGEIFKPVLESWDQLDKLILPDLDNPAYYQDANKLGASGTDQFTQGWMEGWPFATCRYLRKMEIYFLDIFEHRDYIDVLHDRITSLYEGIIDRYGEAGLDSIFFCEDLGTQDRTMFSPAMWRDIYLPLYERLTSRAHKYGMKVIQHSCGYNWELIDDLCVAGIDCLQFDQPAVYDLPALAAKLRGHGVGLFAPCDIQQVLPSGDRDFITRETRRLVETFRGGFIAKNYSDLHGIGVETEWDQWAYEEFLHSGVDTSLSAGC